MIWRWTAHQSKCAVLTGSEGIPTDEMEMAVDLYAALQGFFGRYAELAARPFFITGESYAGKYVPSIGEPGSRHLVRSVLQALLDRCNRGRGGSSGLGGRLQHSPLLGLMSTSCPCHMAAGWPCLLRGLIPSEQVAGHSVGL